MSNVLEVNNPNGSTTLYGPFRFERTAKKQADKAGLRPDQYQVRTLTRGRNLFQRNV